MTSCRIIAVAALALATAACQQAATPGATISESAANQIADKTVGAWTSMDAGRIKALYAPGVVAFDYGIAKLETDRAEFDKSQDAYAAARIDKAEQLARRIQILGPGVFVVSGMWKVISSATPANGGTLRCTDVYQQDAQGNWPIVNEHCSAPPKG